MKASAIRCPACQAAISPDSVDPEYDFDPPDQLIPYMRSFFDARCVNGHHFMVELARKDGLLEVVRARTV